MPYERIHWTNSRLMPREREQMRNGLPATPAMLVLPARLQQRPNLPTMATQQPAPKVVSLPASLPTDAPVVTQRESFAAAKRLRREHGPQSEAALLLSNVRVLDAVTAATSEPTQVLLRGSKIVAVGKEGVVAACAGSDAKGVVEVDCGRRVLMPGLCDAHVHCTAVSANLSSLLSLPESYVTAKASTILEGMLCRGFTTIRDAGGADFGLAQAVDEGVILGPRVLFTGHALSQTGGHGDFRGKGEDCFACGAALRGIGRVCDGDTEVRRAARDELRRGAHCIKIMASGGVASPTDKLTSNQFSMAELSAIVEEAEAAGTYCCAHAYMPGAIWRAVECGVRSIEHGNYLDDLTAEYMAASGTFLVPTLVTYQMLKEKGQEAGMPADLVAKGMRSLQIAYEAGVTQCFGSDLLGDLHPYQSKEFELRGKVLPASSIVRAATINCAELFGLTMSIGEVASGFDADLLLLDADPLQDIGVLANPDRHVVAVIKEGLVAAARGKCGLESLNAKLTAGMGMPAAKS